MLAKNMYNSKGSTLKSLRTKVLNPNQLFFLRIATSRMQFFLQTSWPYLGLMAVLPKYHPSPGSILIYGPLRVQENTASWLYPRRMACKRTGNKSEHKLRHVLQFPRILRSSPSTFATPTLGLKVAGVCIHPLDVAAPAVLAWMLFSRQFSVIPPGEWGSGLLFYVNC